MLVEYHKNVQMAISDPLLYVLRNAGMGTIIKLEFAMKTAKMAITLIQFLVSNISLIGIL